MDEETAEVVMKIMRALFDMVSLHVKEQAKLERHLKPQHSEKK